MLLNKVKNIIIFGGGTSGWLTAAYLVKNLKNSPNIILIENKELGPIGVGEGTQPATSRFLYDAGIMPKTWMKPSKASFKLGVELIGWNDEPYFVDNDYIENTLISHDLRTPDYFIDKPAKEFFDWLPAYRLAKENKSPKLGGYDIGYASSGIRDFGAVHFSALEIVSSIRDIIFDKIYYFDTKIVDVQTNENGIVSLQDEQGRIHSADLYIDCSGFKSLLLEDALGVKFNSVEDILPCNRAVAMPTNFTDTAKECHPYTKSTTMKAGWRWTIPTYERIGNGYVYSDKFITPEEAEEELRQVLGEFDAPVRHLKMRCGTHDQIAYKNVLAVGLSAGFVEPLEATGITFTTKIVEAFVAQINQAGGVWGDTSKKSLNASYKTMTTEILAFVWAHYHFSKRSDTDFWKAIRKQTIDDAPEDIRKVFANFVPALHNSPYLDKTSGFHIGHWFSVLHACGLYKDSANLTPEKQAYIEYWLKTRDATVELVTERFPNHYEFLKEWYENNEPI
jgi:tryptophan halogenase